MVDTLAGPEIAFIVMTAPLQATDHVSAVSPLLNRPHQMDDIDLAGTGQSNDFDIDGILESHGTCQVRSAVSSVLTTKS